MSKILSFIIGGGLLVLLASGVPATRAATVSPGPSGLAEIMEQSDVTKVHRRRRLRRHWHYHGGRRWHYHARPQPYFHLRPRVYGYCGRIRRHCAYRYGWSTRRWYRCLRRNGC